MQNSKTPKLPKKSEWDANNKTAIGQIYIKKSNYVQEK